MTVGGDTVVFLSSKDDLLTVGGDTVVFLSSKDDLLAVGGDCCCCFSPARMCSLLERYCSEPELSLSKIYKSRHYFKIFYFYININCKRVAALFLPMPDWAGGNIAQTYFYAKTCSARLGLDWTRIGYKRVCNSCNAL